MDEQPEETKGRFPDREQRWKIVFEAETPSGKAFDVFLLLAIGLSVIAVMVESVEGVRDRWGPQLQTLEWCFTIIFLFCLVPIVAEEDDGPRNTPKDGPAIDAIIDKLYAAVSFPVGSEPDWDAVRSLVLEEVVFAQPDRGPKGVKIVDLEG